MDIVRNDIRISKAKVLVVDEVNDIAILECYQNIDVPNNINLSRKLPKIGSPIYMIGNVRGSMYVNSLAAGITSYYGRIVNSALLDQANIAIIPRLFWWWNIP